MWGNSTAEKPARENTGDDRGQGSEKKMSHRGGPESREPIPEHSQGAGRKKVSLQRRSKSLRSPASERAINCEWGPVQAIRSAENSGRESKRPCEAIVLE